METSAVGGLARVCISPPSPTTSPLCQTPTLSPLTLHPCFVSLNLLAASGAPTPSLSYLCFYFHLDSASFYRKSSSKDLSMSVISLPLLSWTCSSQVFMPFLHTREARVKGTSEPCLAWSCGPAILLTNLTWPLYVTQLIISFFLRHFFAHVP